MSNGQGSQMAEALVDRQKGEGEMRALFGADGDAVGADIDAAA